MSRLDDLRRMERHSAVPPLHPATYITLVYGPPCAGKTFYVEQEAGPGDVVIDYDALCVALGSPDSHDHPASIKEVATIARDAVISSLGRTGSARRVWLLKCDPTKYEYDLADEIVLIDTAAGICKARATRLGRPRSWARLIDEWWLRHKDVRRPLGVV